VITSVSFFLGGMASRIAQGCIMWNLLGSNVGENPEKLNHVVLSVLFSD
jgi:hypothetical protein